MRRTSTLFCLTLTLCVIGCENHQANVDKLQKEYDDLGKRYRQDCAAELVNVPPKLSPKCSDESKKVDDAWSRLQAERAKQ